MVAADFDPVREPIGALAATGVPHRWVMTTALVLTGVLHVATAWCLTGMRPLGRAALAAAGAATVALAAVPLPARGAGSAANTVVTAVAFVLLAVWPRLGSHPRSWGLLRPRPARWASLAMLVAVASLALTQGRSFSGAHERIVTSALVLWPVATAVAAWIRAGWPIGSPQSKHVLSTVAFSVLALIGGLTATNLAPVTAQTDYYQATVSLSPDPRAVNTIRVPTILGDVSLGYQGAAPGIVTSPQIRAEITEALAQPGMSASGLQPSDEEITDAVERAAVALGTRFLIGAGVTGALILIGYTLVRHRRPRLWLLVSALLAVAIASVGTSAAIGSTYRVDRQPTFATTGALTAVQSNLAILDDVEARSVQVAPYLRNLIVLSGALQENYVEQGSERDIAVRALLVSDIHGANYYPLMRSIIEAEAVDVVIDTGDIINFGSPAELAASGLRDGIASLQVPYVFVRGNHDARSEYDYDVVNAIASIPNAYVLQPSPETYTEIDFGGLRIGGFNDPRYFGDSGSRSLELQEAARQQFLDAFGERPPLDVVVSHEPWAVAELPDVGVALNGHMHTPDLQGNRVQAGTFTGGGPFSHFRQQQPGEELTGQPYAFDVLTFGTDCRLSTLTRFQYRNIVRGRPAYDDITLVNGSRVDTRPLEEGARQCHPADDVRETMVLSVTESTNTGEG